MSKILMVDDDIDVLRINKEYFEKSGYEVVCAQNAASAYKVLSSAALDCIILDVDLPDESGFELCSRAREKTCLPIVFLSGYTEEHNRINGLLVGGDDYICKPYSLQELELRVRARIRAGSIRPPRVLVYGPLTVDAATRTVRYDGQPLDLSTYEFNILYLLAESPGQVFTYEQIFSRIWNAPMNQGLHTLQVLIARVRQKLGALSPGHEYIQTIRRQGYLFVP